MSLSSAESEHYALSEAAKEIKFIVQLLITMGIKVKLPVVCYVDNMGAIFMAGNNTTTGRTRHIDLRMKFVAEFVEEGFLKILFVKLAENLSDGFTKNVSADVYHSHQPSFIATKEYLEAPANATVQPNCGRVSD